MKALYLPAGLLALILALSLWTGQYVSGCTGRWTVLLEQADQAAHQEQWQEAEQHLRDTAADWSHSQTFLHTIMDHAELDQAESLLSGAFAACAEQDREDFHILLAQLICQMRHMEETQAVSIRNIF